MERFRSVLYTDGGDDMYGVIRMSVLRQMAPFNSYHWADRTFVAELALHGRFHNESDFLYFRRDHPMRTSRVGRNNIRLRCSRLDPRRIVGGIRWCVSQGSTCWGLPRLSSALHSPHETAAVV